MEIKNAKPNTFDAGEISSKNDSEGIRVYESDNQQFYQQSLFPNQAADDVSIVGFIRECGSPSLNIHSSNSEVVEKYFQNEDSFNMITTLNDLQKPEETELSHPASMRSSGIF